MFSYQLLPRAKTKHHAKEFKQGTDRTFSGGFVERDVRHADNLSQGRKKFRGKEIIMFADRAKEKKNASNTQSVTSPQRTGHFPPNFKPFCYYHHSNLESAAFAQTNPTL